MFAREAAAYARLSHPAIVKLYDFFSAEGQLVTVLEFIDGLPLNRFRAMLRKGASSSTTVHRFSSPRASLRPSLLRMERATPRRANSPRRFTAT